MKLAVNKKIFIIIVIVFLLIAYCLLIIDSVQAQPFGNLSDSLANVADRAKDPQGGQIRKAELPVIVGGILYGVLGFLGVLCLVLIIYAGIKWTMAGGNQEIVTSAKQTIKYALIGVIVILGAYAASIYIIDRVLVVTEPTITTPDIGGPRGGPDGEFPFVECAADSGCTSGAKWESGKCVNNKCIYECDNALCNSWCQLSQDAYLNGICAGGNCQCGY